MATNHCTDFRTIQFLRYLIFLSFTQLSAQPTFNLMIGPGWAFDQTEIAPKIRHERMALEQAHQVTSLNLKSFCSFVSEWNIYKNISLKTYVDGSILRLGRALESYAIFNPSLIIQTADSEINVSIDKNAIGFAVGTAWYFYTVEPFSLSIECGYDLGRSHKTTSFLQSPLKLFSQDTSQGAYLRWQAEYTCSRSTFGLEYAVTIAKLHRRDTETKSNEVVVRLVPMLANHFNMYVSFAITEDIELSQHVLIASRANREIGTSIVFQDNKETSRDKNILREITSSINLGTKVAIKF